MHQGLSLHSDLRSAPAVKLSEVASFRHGGTPSKDIARFWAGSIPWVSPKDMHTDVVHDTEDHISEEAVRQSATSIVPPDSLLVVIRSGILARKLPVALTGRSVSFNQDIKAIHPNVDRVDPHFLFLALRASEELILTEGVKTGATVHSVVSGFLENLEIPLPPLAEQQRLAERLREQLAAVADARTALQAQLAATAALPAAHLREVFSDRAVNARPLGQFASIQTGYAFKSDWFSPTGTRLLRNANVAPQRIDWTETAHLPTPRSAEFDDFSLNEGDIVLSLDRPLISEGFKVAILTSNDLPCLLVQRVARFYCNEQLHSPYLYYFLQNQEFIAAVTRHEQSLGVPHVSPKQVLEVPIHLPPLPRQRALAAELEARFAEIATLRTALEARLTAVERLPAALLREVFGG